VVERRCSQFRSGARRDRPGILKSASRFCFLVTAVSTARALLLHCHKKLPELPFRAEAMSRDGHFTFSF
jgi:hypothetical protein